MRVTTGQVSLTTGSLPWAVLALAGLASCNVIAISATFLRTTSPAAHETQPAVQPRPVPSPAAFGVIFAGTANTFARAHGDPVRIGNVHCVQGDPGHYMCSYASRRPGSAGACHVMQAEWTPKAASSYMVTLAGRAGRCGSLREALRSLR